ncbi:MAG: DUF3341 domain-containing protein [Planctomycetota bacterium]
MADPLPANYVVGYWSDAKSFVAACSAARDAGMSRAVAYAPFPVHGLEHAMGHQRSWIGRAVIVAILLGAAGCLHFFYKTSVIDWPINVSGKPYFMPEFWAVEIMEAALLAGALVNLLSCFHACKLVPGDCSVVDPRATDDQFCLVLPIDDGRYTAESAERWLSNHRVERVVCRKAPVPTVETIHV